MNYWLIPTMILGFLLFACGLRIRRSLHGMPLYAFVSLGLVAAMPGVVFDLYYLKVLGEPIWLYEFRAVPASELTAAGAGFLAGLLQGWFSRSPRFQKTAGNRLFAILLFFGLLGPYVKPIFRAPFWDQFRDQWSNDVCLQTSESSCGPACAATLLRQLGHPMTEMEIARESFTSRHGTENWYLARTLRRHGATVEFVRQPDPAQPWPHPAIAGVRMQNTGHFITILGRQGDQYTIGDPIGGRHTQSQAAWSQTYEFTGFFLVVK